MPPRIQRRKDARTKNAPPATSPSRGRSRGSFRNQDSNPATDIRIDIVRDLFRSSLCETESIAPESALERGGSSLAPHPSRAAPFKPSRRLSRNFQKGRAQADVDAGQCFRYRASRLGDLRMGGEARRIQSRDVALGHKLDMRDREAIARSLDA